MNEGRFRTVPMILELFHTSGIGDNGYTHGGILNSPPEPIKPEEVDKLWDVLPERK